MEASERAFFPILSKIVNRKQYLIQAKMTESSATPRDLENARMVFPVISLYNSLVWLLQKPGRS